jgi:hypothetical protein
MDWRAGAGATVSAGGEVNIPRAAGTRLIPANLDRHDLAGEVAAGYEEARGAAESEIRTKSAILEHEAGHAKEAIPEALTQVANNLPPTAEGQGVVAGPLNHLIGQAAAVQGVAVGV